MQPLRDWPPPPGRTRSRDAFGKSINHLGGIAVDASGNSYATDLHYGQVWRHSPDIQEVLSPQLGQASSVAVDDAHNIYVVDEFTLRVLKLPAGMDGPTVLPFNDLQEPSDVSVDARGNPPAERPRQRPAPAFPCLWPTAAAAEASLTMGQIPAASFNQGAVSGQRTEQSGIRQTVVSAAISHGMAGGPTVNRDGQVVGVNSGRFMDEPMSLITYGPDLRKYLLANDVDAITPRTPSRSPMLSYWVGGIVWLVLLAAGFGIVRARRTHAATGSQPGDAGAQSRST